MDYKWTYKMITRERAEAVARELTTFTPSTTAWKPGRKGLPCRL
jgi:hypothetical protein